MCFDSGDNGAAAAANQQTQLLEQQQATHDSDVAAGKTAIDSAFSQFDQPYFDNYATSYENAYNPQLTDQYGIAKDKLTAMLAGNGQLGGSAGNNSLAQLDKTYANNQTDIANQAADAENTAKTNVANQKSNLYAMNASAADPASAASQAQASAGSIVSPQSYPTLSNVFGDALSSVATAQKANTNSLTPATGAPVSSWFAPVG